MQVMIGKVKGTHAEQLTGRDTEKATTRKREYEAEARGKAMTKKRKLCKEKRKEEKDDGLQQKKKIVHENRK